ncbi:MAG: phenylalanine--tRNA ligase subunit beta [Thermodesulfobacteriota bacterium]
MKATLNWLKYYVDFDLSPEELGETLTMAGLEVESVTSLAPEKVVAVRIEEVSPHPNADRLSLCSVTDGGETLSIVCGASNMKAGDVAVLALPGAKLPATADNPDGMTVKKAKIRGCESGGMLCSESELGISAARSEGIMILPGSVAPGTPLADVEGTEGVVIEVAVTPNRPDCLSITGIAREIAVAIGGVLKFPPELVPGGEIKETGAAREVKIDNTDACARYCCANVEGVKVGPSPLWLRSRLSACGIKPINNVVDVTNFVMLEFGQPLHAFDSDLVEGVVSVRNASKGESVVALDSEKYDLAPEDLVISDSRGPVAIAGIMGGEASAVSDKTTNVLLEAACFNPSVIRRGSKRLKLSSESSYRFERGVDPAAAPLALARAAALINTVAGGKPASGFSDTCVEEVKPREVEISLEKTWKILGTASDRRDAERLLSALGFEIAKSSGDVLSLKIPTFRPDVSRPADVVEEIARLVGYNAIPKTQPRVGMVAQKPPRSAAAESAIKNVFLLYGFSEAVNYGFDSPELLKAFDSGEMVEVLNPISRELSAMRCTLLAGLLRNLKFNLARQRPDVRLFETGKVFFHKGRGQLPREEKAFSAVASGAGGPDLWEKGDFDFFDMKGLVEKTLRVIPGADESFADSVGFESGSDKKYLHPGKSARVVSSDGSVIGDIGEIHPETARVFDVERVIALELKLEKLYPYAEGGEQSFSPLPKFPSLRRDAAFLVKKDLEVGAMVSGVKGVSPLVERVWVFDIFEDESIGKDMKSVGISMLLRSEEKTLTDEEANSVFEKAARALGDSFGARIR